MIASQGNHNGSILGRVFDCVIYQNIDQTHDYYSISGNEEIVAKNVTENLWERHIRPVFLGA